MMLSSHQQRKIPQTNAQTQANSPPPPALATSCFVRLRRAVRRHGYTSQHSLRRQPYLMRVPHGGIRHHHSLLVAHPGRHRLRPLCVQHGLGRLHGGNASLLRRRQLNPRRGGGYTRGSAALVRGTLPVNGLFGQENRQLARRGGCLRSSRSVNA